MKTSQDLRATLFAVLDDLRADRCTPQKAQAVGKLAAQIVNTANLELQFYRDGLLRVDKAPRLTIDLTAAKDD